MQPAPLALCLHALPVPGLRFARNDCCRYQLTVLCTVSQHTI